jgi:hypothetical protein
MVARRTALRADRLPGAGSRRRITLPDDPDLAKHTAKAIARHHHELDGRLTVLCHPCHQHV